jgi:hypothetical protein
MMVGLKKFLIALVVLSVILLAAGFLVFKLAFPDWYFPFFPVLILIFLLVNAGFIFYFLRFLHRPNADFIRGFMISTGIKLLIYFILILAYILSSPKTAIPFSITVSLLYISYTAFDLYVMLSMVKRRKEKNILPNQLSN